MSPSTTAARPPATRPLADRLRGLLALLVLLVLLVGIPLALYALRGNPLPGPGTDLSGLVERLTTPDEDGTLFLGALTWIGWLAWASFAFPVLLETAAQLRGLPAPHLPALGPQQRAASILVAATALLFTVPLLGASPALATTNDHTAVPGTTVVSAPALPLTPDTPAPEQSHPAVTDRAALKPRLYTVRPGDTLWRIAEDHLGDGARFTEIAQLNYGVAQPDGRALTAAHWLTPGWQLTLPAEPVASTTPAPSVVVEPGDTLWEIAQEHLGAGERYPDIAAASTDLQPDGARLVEPDLIRPGWTLRLPQAATGAAPAAPAPEAGSAGDVPAAEAPAAAPSPGASASAGASPAPSGVRTPATAPAAPVQRPAQSPAAQAQGGAAPTSPALPPPATEPDQDGEPVTVRTAGGVGALLAASLLLLLGLKRNRQQRRRRPGQRIAMPTAAVEAAELELRMVEDPTGLTRVDQALRSLSKLLAEQGQPLPVLRLARLVGADLELYLDGSAHLPEPFVGTGDPTIWILPAETALVPAEELEQVPCPFPSLVTIGHDLDGAHVLLDLEHVGALAIDGEPDTSVSVLAAIAAELATSCWAEDLQVTLVGCQPGLAAALGTGRVRHVETLAELLPALERRAARLREVMAETGTPDLQHARSPLNQPPHAGAWYPEIVLLVGPVDPLDRARLEDLLRELPRVSLAAVTALDGGPAEWSLVLDSTDGGPEATAVLRPVSLALRPQRLTAADLDQLLSLLAVAGMPSQDLPAGPALPALDQGEPALSELGSQLRSPTTSAEVSLAQPASPVAPEDSPAAEPSGPSNPGALADEALDVRNVQGAPEPGISDGHPATDLVIYLDRPAGATSDSCKGEGTAGAARAPLVQVLGPVAVLHARGPLEADRRGQLTEIAAFLALHPGLDHTHLDEAKWPGSRTLEKTRNTALNKLRRWLGTDEAGNDYVPYVDKDGYRLHPDVRSDWDLWQAMLPNGPAAASTQDLAAALELVKGQPFAGTKRRTYAWAERDKQDMISAIGDVAHELARRALLAGDATLARQAAAAGLQADPGAELLWRDALRAEWLAGDLAGLNSTAERLTGMASKLGDDLEPETEELLDELLRRTAPTGGTR